MSKISFQLEMNEMYFGQVTLKLHHRVEDSFRNRIFGVLTSVVAVTTLFSGGVYISLEIHEISSIHHIVHV